MLDLTVVCGSIYDIKLADGTCLHLKMPTQAMYETIMLMGDMDKKDKDNNKLMELAYTMFVRILNRNTEGRVFTVEEVKEEYDFTVALMVVGDYMQYFAKNIAERVPFQPAQ